MPNCNTWTAEQDKFLLENYGKISFVEMGRRLGGLTKHQVRGRYLRLKSTMLKNLSDSREEANAPEAEGDPKVRWQGDDNAQVVTVTGDTVRTLEEAIEAANVDLNKWEVERWDVGKWDGFYRNRSVQKKKHDWVRSAAIVELWRVKLWLKKKSRPSTQDIRKAIIAEMKAYAPKYPVIIRQPTIAAEKYAYEISIPDLHAGKLSWSPETGENYDTKIAKNLYLQAVQELLARVKGMPIAEIWMPLGNDFFHVDTITNTTTAGTPQDVDTRWVKVFMEMKGAVIEAISMMRTVAPVRIPIIPGNHDRAKMFYLGDTLESWFHSTRDVTIDNSPRLRKYITYGTNLVGFTHGSEEKLADLPLLMAQEQSEAWAKTRQREWHIGHLHKKKTFHHTAGDTFTGVVVRTLPALCAADAWHYSKGYVQSSRAAEAYLWGYKTGYSGHFSYNHFGEKSPAEA